MPSEFHSDIPAKAIANVQAFLNAIRPTPTTGLISLTPIESKTMLRTANNPVAFVTKTTNYATIRAVSNLVYRI
jgi:hypothetical protein